MRSTTTTQRNRLGRLCVFEDGSTPPTPYYTPTVPFGTTNFEMNETTKRSDFRIRTGCYIQSEGSYLVGRSTWSEERSGGTGVYDGPISVDDVDLQHHFMRSGLELASVRRKFKSVYQIKEKRIKLK